MEKEQRQQDFDEGSRLIEDMREVLHNTAAFSSTYEDCYSQCNTLLVQANRACELLQFHPETDEYCIMLRVRAAIYQQLGQYRLAVANYPQADEAYTMAERKGLLTVAGYSNWMRMLNQLATVYSSVHQLESAKSCFLRILALPHQSAKDHVTALLGLARYHQERKDWVADRVLQGGPRTYPRSRMRTRPGRVLWRAVPAVPR